MLACITYRPSTTQSLVAFLQVSHLYPCKYGGLGVAVTLFHPSSSNHLYDPAALRLSVGWGRSLGRHVLEVFSMV